MNTHNMFAEAVLMSTHNIGFYEEISKIIFQFSSNIHLICSSVFVRPIMISKASCVIWLPVVSCLVLGL